MLFFPQSGETEFCFDDCDHLLREAASGHNAVMKIITFTLLTRAFRRTSSSSLAEESVPPALVSLLDFVVSVNVHTINMVHDLSGLEEYHRRTVLI